MGQFSVEIWGATGSVLNGNQQQGTVRCWLRYAEIARYLGHSEMIAPACCERVDVVFRAYMLVFRHYAHKLTLFDSLEK